MTGGVDRAGQVLTKEEEWRLRDERDLLQRSLDDAALEHLAGDLADADYELLYERDTRRLAEVDAALDSSVVVKEGEGEATSEATADVTSEATADVPSEATADATCNAPTPAPEAAHDLVRSARGVDRLRAVRRSRGVGRGWWRRRWWLAALGLASVTAAAILLVLDLTDPRLPGEYSSGSISLNTAQTIQRQLDQARILVGDGNATQAIQLYGEVLTEDPRQPVALAEWGWLDWRAASAAREQTVAAEGASALEEAVKVDPKLFVSQYYLGVVLYEEGAVAKAVAHFSTFLDDKPTAKWRRDAAPEIRAAYRAAHEVVPAGVPST